MIIIEPRKLICQICGKKTYRLSNNKEGIKICDSCNVETQINDLNLETPETFVWIGEVARQGKTRMFIIPKSQKPFFKQKVKYSIVVRKLK